MHDAISGWDGPIYERSQGDYVATVKKHGDHWEWGVMSTMEGAQHQFLRHGGGKDLLNVCVQATQALNNLATAPAHAMPSPPASQWGIYRLKCTSNSHAPTFTSGTEYTCAVREPVPDRWEHAKVKVWTTRWEDSMPNLFASHIKVVVIDVLPNSCVTCGHPKEAHDGKTDHGSTTACHTCTCPQYNKPNAPSQAPDNNEKMPNRHEEAEW